MRTSFLTFGDRHEPLIKRGAVYFVKAQADESRVHPEDSQKKWYRDSKDSQKWCRDPEYSQTWCRDPGDSQNWCRDPGDSQKWCVRAEDSQNRCVDPKKSRKSEPQTIHERRSCVGVRKNDGVRCRDADVTPIVRDPMDEDRIPAEAGAEMTPVPHEPSEFEKMKHQLTHIPFQPWRTSCVKGKAQAEPHKRTERIIEDSELPVIQCD